jgi:hypothetical protein
MQTLMCIYFLIIAPLITISLVTQSLFHAKYSRKIIELLQQHEFHELANRLHYVVSATHGFPLQGDRNAGLFFKEWSKFKKLAILKKTGKLYNLQLFYKSIHVLWLITAIFFFIPLIAFVLWLWLSVTK